jgi:Zn-dependent protease with chaperone function
VSGRESIGERRRWGGCASALWCALLTLAAGPRFAQASYEPQSCKNNRYSIEKELEEGQKAKAAVYQRLPVLPDTAPVSQYVSNLGMKLAAQAPGYKWPYEFHVVNEADINAFALPGGPVFVNLGTVQAAETEAQLAGAMAHEIAHVVERHATCNETRERKQQIGYGVAGVLAGILIPGGYGVLAETGANAAAGLGYLRMSRASETDADLLGTDILYDAGYDPRGLPQFFEIIQSKYGKGGAQWLSDHPNPGNRTEAVDKEIASLPHRDNAIKTSEGFTAIKAQIAGVHAYTPKEIANGAWRTPAGKQAEAAVIYQPVDTTASATWKELHDTGFSLEYPDNWQIYDGPGTATTVAPINGLQPGPHGESEVVYGAIVDTYSPIHGSDLATAANQLLGNLKAGNQGLLATGEFSDLTVKGQPARTVECAIARGAPDGQGEHDWLVALQRNDGSLTYVVFVAPEKEFAGMKPAFERMLGSFQLRQ